jgi:glycosyltransferase involved in cell wall biosynthesis
MRILLVNKYWKPVGGVEEHVFMVKRELEALGHEVIPFAMADDDNIPSPAEDLFVTPVDFRVGSKRQRLNAVGRATFGLQTIGRINELLDRYAIDAAHVVHAYHQLGTTFLLTLRRRRIPTVLSLHDYKIACPNYLLFSEETGETCTRCLDTKLGYLWAPAVEKCWTGSRVAGMTLSAETAASRLLGTYRRGAGAVIVLNEIQRRAAVHAGIAPQRIHKIPHFVSLTPAVDAERKRHALFVGRLSPEKGADVAIRACAKAGVPLRIVGDGRSRAELERLAAESGCDATFGGKITPDDVAAEMRSAALLVVSSRSHDVSPLTIVEAIGADLPVLGSDVGGIPDFLSDERGFLCRAGDTEAFAAEIRRLVVDRPDIARGASKRAREYAECELTHERWITRLRAAYASAGASL